MRECVCVRVREGVCVKEIEIERERDETGEKIRILSRNGRRAFANSPTPSEARVAKTEVDAL